MRSAQPLVSGLTSYHAMAITFGYARLVAVKFGDVWFANDDTDRHRPGCMTPIERPDRILAADSALKDSVRAGGPSVDEIDTQIIAYRAKQS